MEKLRLNTDFIKVNSNENNNDFLYLENIINGDVIKLSSFEYSLITDVISTDFSKVLDENPEIYEEDLVLLIKNAIDLELILEENKKEYTSPVKYLLNFISIFFKSFTGANLYFPLKGNIRFFTFIILNLGNSKKHFKRTIIIKLFLVISFFSFLSIFFNLNYIFSHLTISITDLFKGWTWYYLFLFISLICTSSLLHEIGHFIFYNFFGGKYRIFGLGLLYMIIPSFFIRIPDTSHWTNKKNMILMYLGGIFFDLITINIVCYLYIYTEYRILYFFIFFQIFSFITNINFLFPSTDGYFIFEEIFGIRDLYQESFYAFKNIFRKKFFSKNTLLIFFFIISNIMIFFYWITIVVFLILPIFSKILFL